ncbi:MAG TPA: Gldg family protein [Candidatus Acidoferrales bacterium]|nr:Gldg family protein [Candidatus Acidoferrales bacterium]
MKLDRKQMIELGGVLGLVLSVAGYIWYTASEQFGLASKILLIVGGVLVLLWIILDYRGILAHFSKRSSKLGTNTAVLVGAVLAILVFLNYLGNRHHKTFDLTSEKLFTLSDQTKKIVSALKTDVDLYCFDKSSSQQLRSIRDQISEYQNLSRHVHFHAVDPQEQPEMAKQYGVTVMGQVIVVSGPHTQRLEETTEQDITSAILKVTSSEVKTVCFVEGHGEKSTSETGGQGYSGVAAELKKENYQLKSVNLVTSNGVPSDCTVLVEAGPKQALFTQEAQMIEKFLDGSGKVMLLLDPGVDPKLDDVLNAWNTNAPDNYVIDASGVGRLFGASPAYPLVLDYGASPITRDFERSMTFFPLARTVSISDHSKTGTDSVELLKTSAASFTVPKLTSTVKFDPATDQRGPLSLGISAERKSGNSDARLVVIGNSGFATNQWAGQQRNGDLFFNAVNWLSEEESLISIRPKSATNRRVTLTAAQVKILSWFNLVILPLLVILGGILIWVKRR